MGGSRTYYSLKLVRFVTSSTLHSEVKEIHEGEWEYSISGDNYEIQLVSQTRQA